MGYITMWVSEWVRSNYLTNRQLSATRTRKFNTATTKPHLPTLLWIRSVNTISPLICFTNVLLFLHSNIRFGLPSNVLSRRFLTELYTRPRFTCSCCVFYQSKTDPSRRRSTNLFILLGLSTNCQSNERSLLLHLFIERTIKITT
jgi:hypothetical protein